MEGSARGEELAADELAAPDPQWSLARPDWRERIVAGRSLMPDLPALDRAKAAKAIGIYDRLRVADLPGKPRLKEAGADWFRDIVGAMFGCVDDAGVRHIETFFGLVPKKNFKTGNGAALMLTGVILNERPREEFVLIAPTQKIAMRAYGQAEGSVTADPGLLERFHVQAHLKRLTYKPTGASLEVRSFAPKVITGVNGSWLVDELHLLGEVADADRVIGQLRGGLISRPGAFGAYITTQSELAPAGVFAAELAKARAIRDGKLPGRMLPILYEFPEDFVVEPRPGETPRWHDPSTWWMVTPNLNRSVTIERMLNGETGFITAKGTGEAELRRWASQHLNIQIGMAAGAQAWVGAQHW